MSSLNSKRFFLVLSIYSWSCSSSIFYTYVYIMTKHNLLIFLLQLEKSISTRTSKIQLLEKKINHEVDRIYKKFSESVGVKNIREYEENHLKAIEQMAADRFNLHKQQSKLKYQYELYELILCCFIW